MTIFKVTLIRLSFLPPLVPEQNLRQSGTGFTWARCPSGHPTNSAKPLKQTMNLPTPATKQPILETSININCLMLMVTTISNYTGFRSGFCHRSASLYVSNRVILPPGCQSVTTAGLKLVKPNNRAENCATLLLHRRSEDKRVFSLTDSFPLPFNNEYQL